MAAMTGRVKLTAGNLRNFHIYLRALADLIPEGGVGGGNASEQGMLFTVVFQPGSTIETDVAGDKMILRDRKAVREFFETSAVDVGDVAVVERTDKRTLTIWLEQGDGGQSTREATTPESVRRDVDRQLALADDWIRETFSALETMARDYAIDEHNETGPGRRYRFANGAHVRVHPRRSGRIVVGFHNDMRAFLAQRELLIDRADAAWMNFDRGMDLDMVRELIEQAAR
jgi:hypothetical protein